MKKVILLFAFCIAFATHAQESYFTVYNFKVKSQDAATVYKLVDDYYTKNKPEGITVSLYENHLHNSDNNYTHSLVFNGSLDAIGNMYSGGPSDTWSLFLTQLEQHETGVSSATGTVLAAYGDFEVAHPVQRLMLLSAPEGIAFIESYKKFHSSHNPDGMIVMTGDITVGHADGVNRWALLGFKDFKAAFGGPGTLLSGAALAAREKAWGEFMTSIAGTNIVHSGLRVLIGSW